MSDEPIELIEGEREWMAQEIADKETESASLEDLEVFFNSYWYEHYAERLTDEELRDLYLETFVRGQEP